MLECTEDAGIWIGLQGTIESFDTIVQAVAKEKMTVADALFEVAKAAENLHNDDDQASARMYGQAHSSGCPRASVCDSPFAQRHVNHER